VSVLKRLFPDPLIPAILFAALCGYLLPVRGVAADGVEQLANALIVLLFFLHGAKLPRDEVKAALVHWRLHILILAATFTLFPLVTLGLRAACPGLLSNGLWSGLIFVAILPSTVQSSIAFTSIARGNVAAAVTAAAASNLAGVLVTPIWAGLLLGSHVGHGPHVAPGGAARIALLLLLPFIIGHALRPWLKDWVRRRAVVIRVNDRLTIMVSVYAAFSVATVAGIWGGLSWGRLGGLLLACALLLGAVMLLVQLASRFFGFNRADRIAIQFVGSKKSVATGMPMARVLFAGPDLGLVTLPIMLFHQLQLMVCAELARRWGRQ
jgi:sodium/bile acid cotransporter 7